MLSIIVPVLNERESLPQLLLEITRSGKRHEIEYEVIFVDDGSRDDSWQVIRQLSDSNPEVSGIRLRRNFGKAAALTAAMRAAKGELILMMDADLQDDPAEIPNFLAKLNEGFDVVNGWKQRRLDPWHKVFPSRIFNCMIGSMTGLKLHDHNCGLKLFRAEVAREISIYGELHRFIPVLAHARGFRVTEIAVHHRERQFGHSKYGVRRFLRGFLDLLTVTFLTSFAHRPQHILGTVGLIFLSFGFLGLGYLAVLWALMNVPPLWGGAPLVPIAQIGPRPLLAYSIAATLLGGQSLSLGLLAELIVSNTVREQATFSIAERVGPRL